MYGPLTASQSEVLAETGGMSYKEIYHLVSNPIAPLLDLISGSGPVISKIRFDVIAGTIPWALRKQWMHHGS